VILSIAGLLFALIPPAGPVATSAASPGPAVAPRPLKTIVTVKSSPYCNALAEHFNGAFVPMVANDRVFDAVDVQLDDMNVMFNYPDYVNRFMDLRAKIVKESGTLEQSLNPIRAQIDALRDSASLTTDPQAAKQMKDAAAQLQDAYLHQFQLSTDLMSLAHAMLNYNIMRGQHPLNGWTPHDNMVPADEKNVKVVLHFPQQRQTIGWGEDKAVDIATTAAETQCSSAASPSPKP
jgi:hypothetical protein